MNLDSSRLDFALRLVDSRFHFRRNQALVVVIEGPADATFGKSQDLDASLECAVLLFLEDIVGRYINM